VPARTLRLAHRGDRRAALENTITAFLAALAIPSCDGLEFDVRASADGVPVVIHDATLSRVQGRSDRVDALSAAQLGTIGVPALADVLGAVGSRAFLDIELKTDVGTAALEVVAAARGPGLSNAVISSFEPAFLERVGSIAPGSPRWLITRRLDASTVADAVGLGVRGVAVQWRALDKGSIGGAQAAGLEVAAWTVRRRPTFERLARLGVVAMCLEGAALDG
jgi:glycerophosphoryl diester phosphodiesterase